MSDEQRSNEGKRKRAFRSAAARKEAAKEMDRQRNKLRHRGEKLAVEHMRDALHLCAAAMTYISPVHDDGSPREAGLETMAEFFQWMERLHDFATALAPYESPRLASITMRDANAPIDEGQYETIYELKARMIKRGIPVEHLEDRRLVIEHELSEHAGNGHDTAEAV
jgi:hypothetical protein